jgi:mRNA-degrading endonuclease RelE of RelBE toxin-antitoxin system
MAEKLCEKVTKLVLNDIFSLGEKLPNAKFLNRDHANDYNYYYYLVGKYVLQLTFKNSTLVYVALFVERPSKKYICEKDLEEQ